MKQLLIWAFLCTTVGAYAQNENLNLLGSRSYPFDLNDVWGYEDELGNEYALIGTVFGLSIVDVTHAEDSLPEVFALYDSYTIWRDIKTWNNHAYVTCECYSGLLIVDLNPLPDSNNLNYTFWKSNDTFEFNSAHNLYIDENGVAYIFGANAPNPGAIMLDLTQDPMNPIELGAYNDSYLHDGVVRGDTLWGGAVYEGQAQVIDVSDKANPELISAWGTPNDFTHNLWFSDNNKYIFTTDEVENGSIASYDVSNIYNPKEIDSWMPEDSLIIPHNTHFINDFLVTSHYTIGINIIDVKRPHNMIETGRYDTSPNYHYEGFHGNWGAYPWLSSGKILATDIEDGLYVFEPNYVRGCYLEGNVTDEQTGGQVFFPTIEIIEDTLVEKGRITGEYAVATLNAGTYSVKFSADGYYSKTITGVELTNGQLTELNVQLSTWPTGLEPIAENHAIQMYPNPANEHVLISGLDGIGRLRMFDASGKLVYKKELNDSTSQVSFSVSEYKSGVYSIEFQGNSTVYTQKLILE